MMLQRQVFKLIDTNPIRLRLAMELGVSENTIRNYINNESDNLTKAAALKVIRDMTGLTDHELFATSKVKA